MPVVLDISSDEEKGSEEGSKSTDFDWIKEFLFMSDEESGDSDDVVFVHENKPELKSKSSTLAAKDDDDDDDCVVLEGDPEKGVVSVDEDATGSDELRVVGEKGQIACRDYPHPRHLCVKFPFSSTPHERHCGQCHCYVCDSLAPCLMWGTGILSSDHCHANDKTDLWNIQRKSFKPGQSLALLATNYDASLGAIHAQCTEITPVDIIHLSPNSVLQNQASRSTATRTCSSLNSIPQKQPSMPTITCSVPPLLNSSLQNQVSRPINIRVGSAATNLTIPNGANHGGFHKPGPTWVRNRYRSHSVPRQLLGVRGHAIQRERGSGASVLGPDFLRPHIMSKGVGSARNTQTVNHSSDGSSGCSNHVNATQQCDKYHTTTGFSNHRNRNGPDDVFHSVNSSFYSHPRSDPASPSCVDQHAGASETKAYSQPLSQSNYSQDLYQTCIQGNDAPSSYVACLNTNQHGNEQQIRSQNENASGNITECGIASGDTCQTKPHEEGPSENAGKFSAFDSSWTENISQSIEPLIECSPLQSSGSINQPPIIKEPGTQFAGSIEPLIECSHSPGSLVDIENWLLDEDSLW
ncbi:uncharacterized protein LOC133311561 [Gastrolobium bilobum]|uniref:uncharacterized protein LOC133311561 n=1 Tax=Gastrolobium bilobum TaxID=150636 RepID=UPI002AB04D08|nr:uncharacterized protein LOC133311561 [Gastrolobium bilobum]